MQIGELELPIKIIANIAREVRNHAEVQLFNPALSPPEKVEKLRKKGPIFWIMFWLLNLPAKRKMLNEEKLVFNIFKSQMHNWLAFANENLELTADEAAWGLTFHAFAEFLETQPLKMQLPLGPTFCPHCQAQLIYF
ncbi:hypothetical protein TWF718_001534 [Orbilia javanica]|uniref:Uncharacterized protein n=1 Tax=Orbilia javanica TaxID=47235 RepID=A0AAN8RHD4_9PEZI